MSRFHIGWEYHLEIFAPQSFSSINQKNFLCVCHPNALPQKKISEKISTNDEVLSEPLFMKPVIEALKHNKCTLLEEYFR